MAYNPSLDHVAVVTNAREKFASQPASNERSWNIINEAALRLRDAGESDVGLHRKGGTNWNGYSVDIIGYRESGLMFDCLQGAGVWDNPQWLPVQGTLVWAPPVGPEPPEPPDDDLAALTERVAKLEAWASSFRP